MDKSSDMRIEQGQLWLAKGRINSEDIYVIIQRVDDMKNEKIFHISIKCNQETIIEHAPISESALQMSLSRFIGCIEKMPEYKEGYSIWRCCYDKGEAGVYDVPVIEIAKM